MPTKSVATCTLALLTSACALLPTPTPTPSLTPDPIRTYAAQATTRLDSWYSAFSDFRTLNEEALAYPYLFADRQWNRDLAASLEVLARQGELLQAIPSVPTELTAFDSKLDLIGAETAGLVENYSIGLSGFDVARLNMAVSNVSNVVSYFDAAKAEAESLTE